MVHICDDYYIRNDRFNWILIKGHFATEDEASNKKSVNVGDFVKDEETFHMTLGRTLERLLEKKAGNKAFSKKYEKEIRQYIDEIKAIQDEFLNNIHIKEALLLDRTYLKQLHSDKPSEVETQDTPINKKKKS